MTARERLAVVVAPLWVPALTAFYCAEYVWPKPEQFHWVTIAAFLSAAFTYFGVVIFGLPAFIFLRRVGMLSLLTAAFSGFVIAALMWLLFGIAFSASLSNRVDFSLLFASDQVAFTAQIGLLGVLVAATMWLIAKPRTQLKD